MSKVILAYLMFINILVTIYIGIHLYKQDLYLKREQHKVEECLRQHGYKPEVWNTWR